MLDELVGKSKDDRVNGSLGGETRAGGEGEENARGEDEEEKSRREKIPHLFIVYREKVLRVRRLFALRLRDLPLRLPPF